MELQAFTWESSIWQVSKIFLKPRWLLGLLAPSPASGGVLRAGEPLDTPSVLLGMAVTPPELQSLRLQGPQFNLCESHTHHCPKKKKEEEGFLPAFPGAEVSPFPSS